MVAVVPPLLQRYWVAVVLAVKVVLAPLQMVLLATVTVGGLYTSTFFFSVSVQPPVPVTVTV